MQAADAQDLPFPDASFEPVLLRLEGDHLLRAPEKRVQQAGFRVEHLERSRLGIVLRLRARKPEQPHQSAALHGSAPTERTAP